MSRIRFADRDTRPYQPWGDPFTPILKISAEKWSSIESGKPVSYVLCNFRPSVSYDSYRYGIAFSRIGGDGRIKGISINVSHYGSEEKWVDASDEQSCTVPLTQGSGVPVFSGITGKFAYGRKSQCRSLVGVRLSKHTLKRIAWFVWDRCKQIECPTERGRVFAKVMTFVESRELVLWMIKKLAEGTLPRRYTPYQYVLEDVHKVCDQINLIKADAKLCACFECKDADVVYVAPLFEKLSGNICLRNDLSRCRMAEITNAFVVIRQVSESGSVGWAVYLANSAIKETTYCFGGRGEPKDKLEDIRERLVSKLVSLALDESKDWYLQSALNNEFRKVRTQRMPTDEAIEMYRGVLDKIDDTVRRIGTSSIAREGANSTTNHIIVEVFSTFYGVKNENH
jgi:hypothetical protein